jgi:ornithine carbamoyltransferase
MNLSQKITIPQTVLAQIVDDEMVLLETKSEHYFGLDIIGTIMWKQLEKEQNLEKLKQYMLNHYEVEEAQLMQDLETFLSHLAENQLIEIG